MNDADPSSSRDHLLDLACEANRRLLGPDQAEQLARLDRERPSLEAWMDRLVASAETEQALSLAGALARFWWMRGDAAAGLARIRRALALQGGSDRARASALIGAGSLLYATGDFRGAREHHERAAALLEPGDDPEIARALDGAGMAARQSMDLADAAALHGRALAILRRLPAPAELALCLNNLGVVAFFQGDLAAARAYHEEALALRESAGDSRGEASSLNNLGQIARLSGDLPAARALTEEGLKIRRGLGDAWGIAGSYCNIAMIFARLRDLEAARAHLRGAIAGFRGVDDPLGIIECLEAGAEIAAAEGKWSDAVALATSATDRRARLPAPRAPVHERALHALLAEARGALGEDAFALATREAGERADRLLAHGRG